MDYDYDVIVLGAGAPGEHAAEVMAASGLRVAVVERELLGGTCSYWGLIPSKTLLRRGEALAAGREVPGAREAVTGALDTDAALAWRDFTVSDYDDAGGAAWARSAGIDVLRGHGRPAGPHTVAVDDTTYTARDIVIATGSDAAIPPLPGLRDLPGVWTNREVTALTEIPRRLLVVGAGPVGVEMGQALARMHRLLIATGRRPRVDGIGLETVGIQARPHGIPVDDRMSAGAGLWAIGDVTGLWQLTHVGDYQGRVVADNILGRPRRANYEPVPRLVFCDPQAASVGEIGGHFTATVPLSGVAPDRDVHPRVRRDAGLPDPALRRRATHRRVRGRTGGRRMAAAGHPGDPGAHPDLRAAGCDPTVPDVLGSVPSRTPRPRQADNAGRDQRRRTELRRITNDAHRRRS